MENIKVNRITVTMEKGYDDVKISLYKTNELLGTLSDEDLDLPPFSSTGVSQKAYQTYCRDFVIELLNEGGIPGYYYEPRSEVSQSIKYGKADFKRGIAEYVESVIDGKYQYRVMDNERIDITEKYKDNYIKNAVGEIDIKLTDYDIIITVASEIKSGQLCRPKTIRFDNDEYSFNITNIKRIVKSTQ